MDKFTIPPLQNGYSFQDPIEVVSVQLDGGASRSRLGILNCSKKVNVNWAFDRDQYSYFRMFYNGIACKGAVPFFMDLYIDDGNDLQECICRFVPGSVKLDGQQGLRFNVSAQLEVVQV